MSQVAEYHVTPGAAAPARAPALAAARPRVDAIDLVRGLVMVLMALDHVRDFFSDSLNFDPLDFSKTTAPLFLTRWVTHYCAPTFVFLAGTGAFLYGSRGKTKGQLAWFLFSRGLWLVVLEIAVINTSWRPHLAFHLVIGQVIWAIGCCMMILSALVFLPTEAVLALGLAIIAGHNLLDRYDEAMSARQDLVGAAWKVFHSGGVFPTATDPRDFIKDRHFIAAYPVLPWLGVMMAGYGFGQLWLLEPRRRRPLVIALGAAATALFVVLRALNVYGDPHPWVPQEGGPLQGEVFTALDFIRCHKYPPSLLYVLMTVGPAILLTGLLDRPPGGPGRVLVTFGRVPLFYYLLHVPLILALAVWVAYDRYGYIPVAENLPKDYGFGLPIVYLIWLDVVVILYFPCRWFAALKARRRDAWLSYF
jgi:uncharacterized membrane protein